MNNTNGWRTGMVIHDIYIEGIHIPEARVYVSEQGKVFLCQNIKSGADCAANKAPYKYSWSVASGAPGDCALNGVDWALCMRHAGCVNE